MSWLMKCPHCGNYMKRNTLESGKWHCNICGWEYISHLWYIPLFLIMLTFYIGSLVAVTININNKWEIERQKWKPLIEVNKNIPEITNQSLILFYKNSDSSCGLSVFVEISNEDMQGVRIVKNVIILLDRKLTEYDWHGIDYTELPSKKNYALTIIHGKDRSIEISVKANNRLYRKVYDSENSDFIALEVFTRLFGIEA